MLVIAHRGANQEAIENTWDAMEKAIAGGSERIELDVQLSRDGQAYIFHDDDCMRLCGVHRPFAALTAREIAALRLADGSTIPRADETVARFLPRVELNLEIKGRSTATAEVIGAIVAGSPYAHRVIFSCFYPEPLRYLHSYYPELTCAMLWGYDTLEINPLYFSSPQYLMDFAHCSIVHPEVALVDQRFMDQARHRGWRVYPWISLGDEPLARCATIWHELRRLGVEGLCTNWPREFAAWVKEQQ